MKSNVVRITKQEKSSKEEPAPAVVTTQSMENSPPPALVAPSKRLASDKLAGIVRGVVLPFLTFAIVIGVWLFVHTHVVKEIPSPLAAWHKAVQIFSDPFYDKGPNDMGIAWQLLYSLGRVMAGFGLAVAVGVPIGFLMGMSPAFRTALQPLIQILRPVSPLAWLPIGLLLFRAVDPSAIFVIFITCIWPTLVNTAAGVQAVPKDYLNVAAVLRLGKWEIATKILLPATLPYIMTGMRLSLSIAWMVIVAAEMLTGGIGIGFYIWDEWNNLNVPSIIVCIVLIGVVGIVVEGGMSLIQRRFDYNLR
jgi:nitrate/nitrite transport system permease protein